MKIMKFLISLFSFFLFVSFSFGQVVWQTASQTQSQQPEKITINADKNSPTSPVFVHRQIEFLYRKPTDAELQIIAVDGSLAEKYQNFLNTKNTGLFRLMSDAGCASSNKIIVASDYCIKYSMPGNGSAYSFRIKNYRIRHLADLAFKDNYLYSGGRYIQSAMANLGDKDINSVTIHSDGVKELVALMPEKEFGLVAKQVERLKKGVVVNNLLFSNKLSAEKNSTYILRSIAFNAKFFAAVRGVTYNEFDYDKRRDVIIAFRVVEKNDDGSVVLLWKELRNEKAPKLNF